MVLKMDYIRLIVSFCVYSLTIRLGLCYTVILIVCIIVSAEVSKEVCDDEMFQAQCSRGEVIIITKALYGYIGIGRCIERLVEGLECKADVLDIVSAQCDSRSQCEVAENDAEIKALQPCSRGIYMYLAVAYVCISAIPAKLCEPIEVGREKKFISSKRTETPTCSGPASLGGSQYLLTTVAGRTIELSAFGFPTNERSSGESIEVGYMLDEGTEEITPLSIRPDGGRERVLMTSDSNRATLSIHQGSNIHFLIFLKASGCEDMQQPKDMWLDRDHDELTVGCLNSRKSWSLRCEGVHWRGVIGNCTEESMVAVAEIKVIEEIVMALPRDVVLMIIFAVTAVLTLIIITSGYVSYKRSALLLSAPQAEVALLHNDINKTASETHGNRGSISQGPQYTLMRLQENPSQQQPPPVPPRKDNYSAQTTLNLRDQ